MSDMFHKNIPLDYIREVFRVMKENHMHTFQVLTKRAERMAELASSLNWADNVWMGVTVENISTIKRIDYLRNIPSAVRFLSLEPLLGPLPNMDLSYIDWVIVGGESGPGARPIDSKWVFDIKQQCYKADVPFFFKQWGGVNKKKTGRLLNGKSYSEMPNIENIIPPGQNDGLLKMAEF